MDPLDDFLKRARGQTPPRSTTQNLEQRVLTSLAAEPRRRARRRASLALAGIFSGALLVLWVTFEGPAEPAPDFVESVVILGDHTAIWLEPLASATAPEARHD